MHVVNCPPSAMLRTLLAPYRASFRRPATRPHGILSCALLASYRAPYCVPCCAPSVRPAARALRVPSAHSAACPPGAHCTPCCGPSQCPPPAIPPPSNGPLLCRGFCPLCDIADSASLRRPSILRTNNVPRHDRLGLRPAG